jgi:hypothetical protein
MRPCTVCTWPPRTRAAVEKAIEGRTPYAKIAERFNKPHRPVSKSAIRRHGKHILAPGVRPTHQAPAIMPGASLTDRTEQLIAELQAIVEASKATGQLVPAIGALREIRANLEQLGKLSGELQSQNINFFNVEFTEERIKEMVQAAAARGPHVANYLRDQVQVRIGGRPTTLHVHFVKPPERDARGNLLPQVLPPTS